MTFLKITDASGREWEQELLPRRTYSIGRAPDNQIVLHDPRASRRHAQIRWSDVSGFVVVDGYEVDGETRRSVNKVFVNGKPHLEKTLVTGDQILIGGSRLVFFYPHAESGELLFEDKPLGNTQFLMSAEDVMQSRITRQHVPQTSSQQPKSELEDLRQKAKILGLLYEMSKTLGSVFDLKTLFMKATEIVFEVTPADRAVAMLADEKGELKPIASKTRDESLRVLTDRLPVSRTVTRKAMTDKMAILSQDARLDSQFSGSESIVSQGVRSTICAPLVAESGVHGVIYADRLDPFAAFSQDDLALISAIAAQTAVAVETARAHERLAREEVARANYSRFLPPFVVQKLLENPESFTLGGTNQLITVLFADIRGFSRIAERERPEKIVRLLNRFFSEMTEIVFAHGGTLDKYIGDEIMALFGAPTASADDASNAVQTAIEMQKRLHSLNIELKTEGFEPIGLGIGLHTGEAIVGYVGSERRSEYTAIGDTVNLASRLQANALAGQILLSGVTAQAVTGKFSLLPRTPITVKNRVQPVPLFEVNWS
ncbi:MAG: GAF domain-containing protein [Acidobacteriota bacterium]|nr:GAF domain-containing protein [Acidobacteriota bacterium]